MLTTLGLYIMNARNPEKIEKKTAKEKMRENSFQRTLRPAKWGET